MRSTDRRHQSPPRKREREESEDEGEDSEDFSQDRRAVDAESRRARKPRQYRKRPRVEDTQDASAQLQQGLQEQTRAEVTPPREPTPTRTSHDASSPRLVGMHYKRFTEEDDQVLINYIKKHGRSWADIKDDDFYNGEGRFRYQTTIQLKDRARNIKMKIIRGIPPGERTEAVIPRHLPRNFDGVTLSQEDRRKLGIR